jgi:ABC-type transport system involved in multi-copper enzyme maturation permease subunit
MLEAFAAETLKFRRHRATWFLVWIYPIGFLLLWVLLILVGLAQTRPQMAAPAASKWIESTAAIWYVPPHMFGRYLISAFAAFVFAGEYGWNTWKLVVPHRSRSALIAAKFATTILFLYGAFVLTGLLTIVLGWLGDVVLGSPTPTGITAAALAKAHYMGALKALPPVLVTIAYTSLAAVLTRSTIAALVIGLVAVTAEQAFLGLAPLLANYAPRLVWALYQLLPGYHFDNLSSWLGQGAAFEARLPGTDSVAWSWPASLALIAGWVIGVASLTFVSFKRQDIN